MSEEVDMILKKESWVEGMRCNACTLEMSCYMDIVSYGANVYHRGCALRRIMEREQSKVKPVCPDCGHSHGNER